MSSPRPPGIPEWVIARLLPERSRDAVMGDLQERYATRAVTRGEMRADLWYWRQALGFAVRVPFADLGAVARASLGDPLRQDLGYALRALARSRGFALTAVLTLAVGLATVTGLFRVVNGVLLMPLDYPRPERLVIVTSAFLSPDNFAEWERGQPALEAFAAYSPSSETARLPGGAVPASVHYVSEGFFDLFGERALRGRLFLPEDHAGSGPGAAVVRESFWREHLGARDPSGLTLDLEGRVHPVVGVVRDGFRLGYNDRDVWVPMERGGARGVGIVGRLRDGLTPGDAKARLTPFAESLATPETLARQRQFGLTAVNVLDAREALVGDTRRELWTLLGAAAVVLVLACANVATLFLARTLARREELAVRAALGAGRSRIVRQLLVEAAVLSGAGAALGLLFAAPATAGLLALAPDYLPRTGELATDWKVIGFAVGAAAFAVAAFGLLPAWLAARSAVARGPSSARAATAGRIQARAQSALVVAEIGAALVMVAGAGLLVRTFLELNPVDPGFQVSDRMSVWIGLPDDYDLEADARFVERLVAEIGSLPGAPGVAATTHLPLTGTTSAAPPAAIDDEPKAPEELATLHWKSVTPGYLELMEMPILAGRTLAPSDAAGAPNVAVVNETAARTYWPGASPIGRRITLPSAGEVGEVGLELTVVGVVRDAWFLSGPGGRPELFASFPQNPSSSVRVVVESPPERPVTETDLRGAVAAVDPRVAVTRSGTLRSMIERSVVVPRFHATLLGVLAGVSLFLACVGCFAALSHLVRRRNRELAMRMAMGATRGAVLRLVLARGMLLTGAGLTLGLLGSLGATRVLASQLYGVTATDPTTLAAAAGVLALCSAGAAAWPSLRATRVQPAEVLREE